MLIQDDFVPLVQACRCYDWPLDSLTEKFQKNVNVRVFEFDRVRFYLYNYKTERVLVPRDDPLLIKCRGLVLRQDGLVLNYPLDRFFNEFEKESATIDWSTAQVQEKVDGTMISVWFYKRWHITTRGSFYPLLGYDVDFAVLFERFFNQFHLLSKENCYFFELVTPENRIVTWYDKPHVVLLGARNLNTFQELTLSVDLLPLSEQLAKENAQIRQPIFYSIADLDGCLELFEQLKDDEEGLVIVDKEFNRLKLKQKSYFKLSKIKMLKPEDLFDYILGRTELDGEYLAKVPEVLLEIEQMKVKWEALLETMAFTFEWIIKRLTKPLDRKEFALKALKFPFRGVLFAMYDHKDFKKKIRWAQVEPWNDFVSLKIESE